MAGKRRVVLSAGFALREKTLATVRRIACGLCEIEVMDMRDPAVAARAKSLGVRTVPAVVTDGGHASCCACSGPERAAFKTAGIGAPLP